MTMMSSEERMKVPLIATINHRTIDMRDSSLKVKIYRNGGIEVATSPFKPYYYMANEEGEEYKTIASDETVKLSKHHYLPMRETVPPTALYDGGREALLERLCIEHPEFFKDYPNDKPVKFLVFDIETKGFEFPTEGKWIYASPDGGETIYRREFGKYESREKI